MFLSTLLFKPKKLTVTILNLMDNQQETKSKKKTKNKNKKQKTKTKTNKFSFFILSSRILRDYTLDTVFLTKIKFKNAEEIVHNINNYLII